MCTDYMMGMMNVQLAVFSANRKTDIEHSESDMCHPRKQNPPAAVPHAPPSVTHAQHKARAK